MFRHLSFEDDLQVLKKSLVQSLPSSAQMLNILNIKIQKRLSDASQVKFFLFEDENRLDSTTNTNYSDQPFVICTQQPNIHSSYNVVVLTPPIPTKRMLETFEDFVEWDKVRIFSAVNQSFFIDHLRALCLKHGELSEYDGIPCESYTLDPELALTYPSKFLLGPGEEVKEWLIQDTFQIIRDYKYTWPHCQFHVEESIRNLCSTAVYVESEIASSALLSPIGLINILNTSENHRRKGYGQIVVQTLSKSISSLGLIPMAECEDIYPAARNLLIKSGFRFHSLTNWIRFSSK